MVSEESDLDDGERDACFLPATAADAGLVRRKVRIIREDARLVVYMLISYKLRIQTPGSKIREMEQIESNQCF